MRKRQAARCTQARELSRLRATTRRRGMTVKPSVSFDWPTISRRSGSMSSFSRSRRVLPPVPPSANTFETSRSCTSAGDDRAAFHVHRDVPLPSPDLLAGTEGAPRRGAITSHSASVTSLSYCAREQPYFAGVAAFQDVEISSSGMVTDGNRPQGATPLAFQDKLSDPDVTRDFRNRLFDYRSDMVTQGSVLALVSSTIG